MDQLIDNKGDLLFTTVHPNPEHETVIVLHGGPGMPLGMKEVAGFLEPWFRVITFDQRGTRRSPCKSKDFSMEAYLSDLRTIFKFYKISKAHLFGHSWGGLYAQIYAEKYPETIASLFLSNPASGTGALWKQTEREVLRFNLSKCNLAEAMGMGINTLLGLLGNDAACRRLYRQVVKNYHKGIIITEIPNAEFANVTALPVNKTRAEIGKYPALRVMLHAPFPVTILYGDNDIYGSSREHVSTRYPEARVFTLEHCGHIPWLHQPDQFKHLLKEHFRF